MDKRTSVISAGIGICMIGIITAFLYFSNEAPVYTEDIEPPGVGITGTPNTVDDPFDTVVTFTENGFTPAQIEIKKGTRVRFLNASKQEFWPASGVHPTHSLYPEKEKTDCLGSSFDSCKSLAPGEFFDFTFYYEGEWSFHDHLHAYQTGRIIVSK